MANTSKPLGFVPIGHISGGAIPEPHQYVMTTSQTIYKGDAVIITSSGTVSISAAGQTTTNLGVAAEYVDDSAGAGGKTIKVYDDIGILYMVESYSGDTPSQTTVFNTADITATTGNTVTKVSKQSLATAGTSTKPWIILRLFDSPDNAWGQYAKVVVKPNRHTFSAPYAGL
jgi:hypothetical protein